MAAINNIGSQFHGNWNLHVATKKENLMSKGKVLRVSFYSPQKNNTLNNKRRLITSCNGNTSHKVDTINGITKVNGLQVAESPLASRKLPNENTQDIALVTNGKFVEGRFVFRQIFVIRSYEIGPDRTATMETLMNFLQVSFTILLSFVINSFQHKHSIEICLWF